MCHPWASADFFQGKAKIFQGGGARTYFLPKNILLFSKKSKNILFLAGLGPPCPAADAHGVILFNKNYSRWPRDVPGVGDAHLWVDGELLGGRKCKDKKDVVGVREEVEWDYDREKLHHPGALNGKQEMILSRFLYCGFLKATRIFLACKRTCL